MKIAPPSLTFPVAVFFVASIAVTTMAQEPAIPPSDTPAEHHEHLPAPPPKNLKVLPTTMKGEQVHDLMHLWEAALGTECSHCHAVDPTKKGPNGRPALNFADDSKPEKATARQMYRMTEEINAQYISKLPESDAQVTCGTCHRGHITPQPFIAPPEPEHVDHDHENRPAGAKPNSGQ